MLNPRTYERGWLRFDLVAGIVLAAILVPQGMAYAELAGLPPVNGLYTTIACLVAYAIFGPSRVLVLGPDSSVSPLILASITPLVVVGDPGSAIVLAGMLAVLVGLIEIGLGVAKLGFVADLLSSEVRVGYMNGLAVTIIVGQLPKLFGFSTDADGFVDELTAFWNGLDQTNRTTLITGLAVLLVLLVLPRITTRIPAVLVAIVGVTVVSALLGLADEGVKTVGTLPQGFPTPSLPWTSASDALALMVGAVGITMVSLTDTIATASSFAARRGDEVDANAEMIGVGASNVVAGFFQGFAVSVSSSRTAVADQSGARTQLTGLVGAGLVAHVMHTGSTTEVLEWPAWILYMAIPLGSYLMCFRFLQVAWAFHRTGDLPHHDHGHVEGVDDPDKPEDINWFALDDDLHPREMSHPIRKPEDGGKPQ